MPQLTISFSVPTQDGENPPTKGSAKGFTMPGKFGGRPRVIIVNDNPKNKAWARLVGLHARDHKAEDSPWNSWCQLSLVFTMKRLKKMPKGRDYPTVKPDLDKMVRSVLDALTGILYVDDAQIIALAASKEYGDRAGVYIELTRGGVYGE